MAEYKKVDIVFANLDTIHKYKEELFTITTVKGIDGTFKTVPRCPPQFTKDSLLTFQVALKNVVSIISIINNLIFMNFIPLNCIFHFSFSNVLCTDFKIDTGCI